MADDEKQVRHEMLRLIPSVDQLLLTTTARRIGSEAGHSRLVSIIQTAIEEFRSRIDTGEQRSGTDMTEIRTRLEMRIEELWDQERGSRLRRVINATGVVIHTNLGRAPLSDAARKAVDEAAGNCTLEFDIRSGSRGRRASRSEELAAKICAAEAAVVVNNCAAAAYMVLAVFAAGREVIVSRGELVEIGGDFRIPDILAVSGAIMREVGTTNRTKPDDYDKAVNERTAMILKVHPSNFRVVGFTRAAGINELAPVAGRAGVILYEDAGSGAMIDLAKFGIDGEPDPKRSIADGADLVSFSGDKLLGGPQAGIIVGRRELIEQLRRHPLYRTYRPGKLIYAALEATLEAYAAGRELEEIPVLRMLAADHAELKSNSEILVKRINESCRILTAKPADSESVLGGGAAPGAGIRSPVIILTAQSHTASELMELLRTAETPVIARVENGSVLLDLRTVGDVPELFAKLQSVDQRLENSSMKAARHSAPSTGNAL